MMSSEVIVVGCGSSCGVPAANCLVKRPVTCAVCADAQRIGSRNARCNPSMLVKHRSGVNILIDCGKSFRHAMLKVLAARDDVVKIDAVLLTHAHADAMLGLDDLREWVLGSRELNTLQSIPIWVRDSDLESVRRTFPYLVDRAQATGSGHVANLEFHTFDASASSFSVLGVDVVPIVVEHGAPCEAVAFRIGDFLYMSDVSVVPPAVVPKLQCADPRGLELLVLDATFVARTISSHVNFPQALDIVRTLKPRKTIFTGLTHEFDYHYFNALLRDNYSRGLGAREAGCAEPVERVVTIEGFNIDVALPYLDIELPYETQSFVLTSL
jgi:phosphoribosyl 1,2-cyclic phosphodiesterase